MAVKDLETEPVKLSKSIKSVAIIGGGASGAIALESILNHLPEIENVTIYERRNKLGGVWNVDQPYGEIIVTPGSTEAELDPQLDIPKDLTPDKAVVIAEEKKKERYAGAPLVYGNLRTNVPERVMTFSSNKKFPYLDQPEKDELTTVQSVNEYLVQFLTRNVKDRSNVHLKLSTFVEKITKQSGSEDSFEIVLREELNDQESKWYIENFDAVIVATGHYNVPYIPEVEGLDKVIKKFPGRIVHSKGYSPRHTEEGADGVEGKKFIVVGGRASSVDTVRNLYLAGAKSVAWSQRNKLLSAHHQPSIDKTPPTLALPPDEGIAKTERKPVIVNYDIDDQDNIIVNFEDGTKIVNPDKVIYATGYHFSFPFLREFDPEITHKGIVPNVYLHTFHFQDPLLSFVGIPMNGMSFRVFEFQLILVARFLAGKVDLPSLKEQIEWRDQRLAERGYSKLDYHNTALDPLLDFLHLLAELGGGYEDSKTGEQLFPRFSETDLEVYEVNRQVLQSRWSLL